MFDPFFFPVLLILAVALMALLAVQRRLKTASLGQAKLFPIRVAVWLTMAAVGVFIAWPFLFLGPTDPAATFYVETPKDLPHGVFQKQLASILRARGFNPQITIQSTPSSLENPMFVLEAKSPLTRIWSQTMPLSSEEAVTCGLKAGTAEPVTNDQRHYIIDVTPIPFFRAHAEEVSNSLKLQVQQLGYTVSAKPIPCSPSA